jgi:hypothetical protein
MPLLSPARISFIIHTREGCTTYQVPSHRRRDCHITYSGRDLPHHGDGPKFWKVGKAGKEGGDGYGYAYTPNCSGPLAGYPKRDEREARTGATHGGNCNKGKEPYVLCEHFYAPRKKQLDHRRRHSL